MLIGYIFTRETNPVGLFYEASPIVKVNNRTKTIQKLTLDDGSVVWLHPQSILEYPERFSGSKRQVKVSGEAFFEISHDKVHPFIVTSGQIITRVVGTSFRILANPSMVHHD